jgi:hypothetical protein
MASAQTYSPIATTTLGSSVLSYTFSSIPSTYTDLIMVFNGTAGNNVSLQFNGDTANNYSSTRIQGNGSAASSSRWTGVSAMYGSYSAGLQTSIWQVLNYANTTTYKTGLNRGGGASDNVEAYVARWGATSAITSMTVIALTSTLAAGSTLTLYGIAAA